MMRFLKNVDRYFGKRKENGVILLRLVIGWRLIDGTLDNVLSWSRMLEFRAFLQAHNVAFPLIAANVSVYGQFICGILYIAGMATRLAALVMIVNFLAALYIAHIGLTFEQSFDALAILAASGFFLFHGPGKYSVDGSILQQKKS